MNVYWLEQSLRDVPPEDDWLSDAEAVRLHSFRIAKRRADWRLGRWTAKLAVRARLDAQLPAIEIRPADSGAPEVFLHGRRAALAISLSHRGGVAACALAPAQAALGCDLELIEPRSDAFLADYFTREERDFVARRPLAERFRLLALLWSAKESALKALTTGLRLDTRSVSVSLGDTPTLWRPLQVHCDGGETFDGWWRTEANMVRTMAARPSANPPIQSGIEISSASTTSAPGGIGSWLPDLV